MQENSRGKHYITNMDKKDPIINNFIKETENEEEIMRSYNQGEGDISVNFSITYGNGEEEKFTCGNESPVFGGMGNKEHKNTTNQKHKKKEGSNSSVKNKVEEQNNTEINKNNVKGIIKVVASLGIIGGEPLTGVKINLYVTNGVSPRLIRSIISDASGVVVFNNLECGNYRVIEIIDKNFFEKPIYKKWNEVNINDFNKYEEVFIINNIKECYM